METYPAVDLNLDTEAGLDGHRATAVESHALGVELHLPGPIMGLPRSPSYASGGRQSWFTSISSTEAKIFWRPRDVRRIVDSRSPDGAHVRTVDHDSLLGYRYWGRARGECLISADGRGVLCSAETDETPQWERFLIGQILPFVAPLQGVEVMHGSAVEIDGRAVAFLSGSSGGKTSLAAQLTLRGATPITDDVLALERTRTGVLIHPGPGILGIRHREADRLGQESRSKLGPVLAENDKEVVVGVERSNHPTPLASMYFISHDRDAAKLALETCQSPEQLIGSTFNTVLTASDRMERMLDVCLDLARTARTTAVKVPIDVGVEELADAIIADLNSGA